MPIECNTLLSNGEFPDMRADGVVELGTAHTEIRGGVHHSNEAWRGLYDHR